MTASFYYWLMVTKDVAYNVIPTLCGDCKTSVVFINMMEEDKLNSVLGNALGAMDKDMMVSDFNVLICMFSVLSF